MNLNYQLYITAFPIVSGVPSCKSSYCFIGLVRAINNNANKYMLLFRSNRCVSTFERKEVVKECTFFIVNTSRIVRL